MIYDHDQVSFQFQQFFVIISFLTRVLTSCILFLTSLRAVVVAKSVILGISPLPLLILALRAVVVATLGILSSISLILQL